MAGCTTCNLCPQPGTYDLATEKGLVPCNVRYFRESRFTYWRCSGCDSLHCLEDADLPAFYAPYPLKDQKVTFNERVGYRNRLQLLIRQGFARTGTILDYGCGSGLYVNFLRKEGIDVAGYDSFVSEFSDESVLNRTYDAVVSYDVIEHDDDPRAFLNHVVGLVRPGGLLVIGTPKSDGTRLRRPYNPALHAPYHRHILSERMLVYLGKEQGLTVAQVYRRSFYDSAYPTVNSAFMWNYLEKNKFLDAAVEPPNVAMVMRSPKLMFLALFGRLVNRNDNMLVTFRKPE